MKKVIDVIVLGVKPYSENSNWVSFFSKENGIQNGIIKGGKKKRTKALILGLYSFTIYRPSSKSLQNIVDLERTVPLDSVYTSPKKVLIAFFVADSFRCALVNCGEEASFYDFAKKEIVGLSQENDDGLYPVFFLARLISFLGYAPLPPKGNIDRFDVINGVFNPDKPSSGTINNREIVKGVFFAFHDNSARVNRRVDVFDVLVNYARQHVPGFKFNKAIGTIRDVLYS